MRSLPYFFLLILSTSLFAETEPDIIPYRQTIDEKHDMRVVNSGSASLYARVDMIRRAQKTIDLESYIFNTDTAGKMILQELARASERGVKVRILVDKFATKVDPFVAEELKKRNIEVKYYNPASVFNLGTYQYRNHRKLLIRDGEEAITGGRNIADEYFDLSHRFNFHDRDATVEGPIVKTMGQSFENFFNSKMSEVPYPPREPSPYHGEGENSVEIRQYEESKKKAKTLFEPDKKVEKALASLLVDGKEGLESVTKKPCPSVTFASDREGAGYTDSFDKQKYHKEYRYLSQEILEWIEKNSKEELVIDTPYFLQSPVTSKILKMLNEKKVKVKVFTNSLASTDAIHVSSVFNDYVTNFTPQENFGAYVYKGKYSGEGKVSDEGAKNATLGDALKNDSF